MSLERPFEASVPAKWVLAGEHAVLRGYPAVVLPHPELGLRLTFAPDDSPEESGVFRVQPSESAELIGSLLDDLGVPRPRGTLTVQSSIPLGAGLGSSAAFCVALVRWVGETQGVPRERWFELARSLENRFHGQSSGMDVALALAQKPIVFAQSRWEEMRIAHLPRFTFHDTGLRSSTRHCVGSVEALSRSDLDQRMGRASELAIEGLRAESAERSLALIRESMDLGQSCFRAWGLLNESSDRIEAELRRQGALAVKMTGAGQGGFLLALWGSV